MAAQQGDQTSSDVGETDRDSQQDLPHPGLFFFFKKERFEIVGSKNNSWPFL